MGLTVSVGICLTLFNAVVTLVTLRSSGAGGNTTGAEGEGVVTFSMVTPPLVVVISMLGGLLIGGGGDLFALDIAKRHWAAKISCAILTH